VQALLLFIFAIVALSMWQAGTGKPRRITWWFAAMTFLLTIGFTSYRIIG
jgi:hypothetical protein